MLKKLEQLFLCGLFVFSIWASPVLADGLIPVTGCFQDFNGNGMLDSGEFGECAATPQGQLCLLDHIPCVNTQTAAVCPGPSALNIATDQCESPTQYRCTTSGMVFQTLAACNSGCAQGTDCVLYCPDNLSIQGNVCRAAPGCPSSTFDSALDACVKDACPYGDGFICQEWNGQKYCSAQLCFNSSEHITSPGTPQGSGDLQNNGPKDSTNQCLGHIYIFSGYDRRCRTSGATILFDDCCKSKDYLWGLLQCNQNEQMLAELRGEGLCHYVGQYCSQELHLLLGDVCVEESKSYCCFNSKLARIVQEQGRPQLNTFNGWGLPSSPNCRGFTPEEFQVLDFSLIDLSEWYGSIKTKPQNEIETNMKQGVTDYYNSIQD